MNIVKPASLLNVSPSRPVDRAHPLNRGMVGWWLALPHLAGGSTVHDLGGKWDGTLYTNTTYRPSWAGADRPGGLNSVYINGNPQQFISLPAGLSGAFTGTEATFAVWMKKISPSGSYSAAGLANLGPPSQVSAWGGSGYNCYFSIFENLVRPIGPVTPGAAVIEAWTHIVVTTAPGTNNYRLLLNGKLYATGTQSSFWIPPDPNFGGASTSNQEAMAGWADDWRLWNRALSDDEVGQLYRESRAGYPTMLVRRPLYWSVSGSQSFTFGPSGGADLGGVPTATAGFAAAPYGGSPAGGYAGPAYAGTFGPSGGSPLGGYPGNVSAYGFGPSGGSALGGYDGPTVAYAFAAYGGSELGGSPSVSGSTAYAFSPFGGSASGGSPATSAALTFSPYGGAALGGFAQVSGSTAYAFAPYGGSASGGSPAAVASWVGVPYGGAAIGGTADLGGARVYAFSPYGGSGLGGSVAFAALLLAVDPSKAVLIATDETDPIDVDPSLAVLLQ